MKLLRDEAKHHPRKPRRKRLTAVATLPTMMTLGNLLCGFGAIYCAILAVQADGADLSRLTFRSALFERMMPTYLAVGAYLVFAALIFDALDGRLARLTRRTSDFGGQLDSLADMVSFGAAPAALVLCLVMPLLREQADAIMGGKLYWRMAWVAAAVYVACTAIRLARFNVENIHDESAHMSFRGLPAPGAGVTLAALIVLHEEVIRVEMQWASRWLMLALPVAAFVLGLVMVSSLRYVHLVNVYLRGRRPISHLVALLIVVTLAWVAPQLVLAVLICGYALSAPTVALWRRLTSQAASGHPATPSDQAAADLDAPADRIA
ncbi:MAG TPA: CDP-alcohol phosphatidyltransferase family protein [Phycisphaerae bacterium]|nr:CDP-alcohol phosphatidyltransferase family protein [Phycisphaerae bacterium]